MRTLRLSLSAAVILALLGLLSVGPVTASDGQCQPEKSTADLVADQAKAKAELDAANDEVADLLLKLMRAGLRQQAAKAKLDEATYCLDAKKDADKKAQEDAEKAQEDDAGKAIDLPNRTTRTTPEGYVVTVGDDIAYVIECTRKRDDGAVFGPSDHPAADYDLLVKRLPDTCLRRDGYTTERWIVEMHKDTWEPTGRRVPAHP